MLSWYGGIKFPDTLSQNRQAVICMAIDKYPRGIGSGTPPQTADSEVAQVPVMQLTLYIHRVKFYGDWLNS